jgi:hypothetical protein
VFDMRASKEFRLLGEHRVEFDFDVFNLLNSSAPLAMNFQSGPTFRYATDVVAPRVARLGVRYSF